MEVKGKLSTRQKDGAKVVPSDEDGLSAGIVDIQQGEHLDALNIIIKELRIISFHLATLTDNYSINTEDVEP